MLAENMSTQIIQMSLWTIVVLLFIIGLAWTVKRSRIAQFGFQNDAIKTISGLALGTRERIVLIQVGEKQVLLGVSPGQIHPLFSFDENVIDHTEQGKKKFAQKLDDALHKGK